MRRPRPKELRRCNVQSRSLERRSTPFRRYKWHDSLRQPLAAWCFERDPLAPLAQRETEPIAVSRIHGLGVDRRKLALDMCKPFPYSTA